LCVPALLLSHTSTTEPLFSQAELAQSSDLIALDSYLSSPLPDASTGETSFSVVSLLSRPFWWGLSKVWGSSDDKIDLGEQADENEWKKRVGEWAVPDLVEVRNAPRVFPPCY
jgi:charged multivesicular body protein 7